jgi:hypothetical protein
MMLSNIHRILSIKGLWVDITCNHYFLDYKIITRKETPCVRCALLIFFDGNVPDHSLKAIHEGANSLIQGESIGKYPEIKQIYGMKMLVLA